MRISPAPMQLQTSEQALLCPVAPYLDTAHAHTATDTAAAIAAIAASTSKTALIDQKGPATSERKDTSISWLSKSIPKSVPPSAYD